MVPQFGLAQSTNSTEEKKNVSEEDLEKSLSPAAKVIFDSDPTTPTELIKAINRLIAFGDWGLAKKYAVSLGQKGLQDTDIDLTALGDDLGPASLIKIIHSTELDSRARDYCKKILAAVRERDIDPQRLAGLATTVTSKDPIDRRNAMAELRAVGSVAVAPLVQLLLSDDPSKNVAGKNALVALGRQAVPPILAVMQTDKQQLRNDLLFILSKLQDASSKDDLLIAMLSPENISTRPNTNSEVVRNKKISEQVKTSIHHYLSGQKIAPLDLGETITLWEWDDEQSKLTRRESFRALSSAQAAYRLARSLSRATSKNEHLLLEGVALLQWEKLNRGLSRPISERVVPEFSAIAKKYQPESKFGILDFAEAVFEKAIELGYTPAAIAAADILTQSNVGDDEKISLLTRRGADPHPLVKALGQKDRRLRMACCQAILHLTAEHPFVGASNVSDALCYFAASEGKPRVLIADNRPLRRQKLATLFANVGYKVDGMKTGREAIQAAQKHPDYVAAFISANIGPRSSQDIFHELRGDSRTAGLPIALIVDPQHTVQVSPLVDQDSLTAFLIPPQQSEMAQQDIESLVNRLGENFVPPEERLEEAREAIRLFGILLERLPDSRNTSRWEQVLIKSLKVEKLAVEAASVLGQLHTPTAQQSLADAASAQYLPLSTRQAAANAFGKSVAKHGIGLSIAQIQQQKDRYDASEGKGPEEEAILWGILEAIENSVKTRPEN